MQHNMCKSTKAGVGFVPPWPHLSQRDSREGLNIWADAPQTKIQRESRENLKRKSQRWSEYEPKHPPTPGFSKNLERESRENLVLVGMWAPAGKVIQRESREVPERR